MMLQSPPSSPAPARSLRAEFEQAVRRIPVIAPLLRSSRLFRSVVTAGAARDGVSDAAAPGYPWRAARVCPPRELREAMAKFVDQFTADTGFAWYVPAPSAADLGPGDTVDAPHLSRVRAIIEDGTAIGPPHSLHEAIRELGGGRFSHWGDTIYFSASDNTNPNRNGRAYEIEYEAVGAPTGPAEVRRIPLHPEWEGLKIVGTGEIPPRLERRYPLAEQVCRGRGIEVGGAAYNQVRGMTARNIGRRLHWHYVQESLERFDGFVRRVDIIAEGDHLPLRDDSVDYVFSSHVLEHFPDPIRALVEWDRVLKPGGIMLAVVPHKERTFDRHLPRTSLDTQFERYGRTPTGSEVPDQHYSIWVTRDVLDLINAMNARGLVNWSVEAVEDRDRLRGNGFAIACRKQPDPGMT